MYGREGRGCGIVDLEGVEYVLGVDRVAAGPYLRAEVRGEWG